MNTRLRTANLLQTHTFELLSNQQQIDGVSIKLTPLKTGPYLIAAKPTDTTDLVQGQKKRKNYHTSKSNSTIFFQKKNKSNKNYIIIY